MHIKRAALILFVFLTQLHADFKQVRELYELILAPGSERIPSPEEVGAQIADTMNDLPSDNVQTLLLLGKRCLASQNISVRRDGLIMMMTVGLRPDSAALLEPYVDDLARLLDESAIFLRQPSIYILSTLKPKPPAKATAVLRIRLRDKMNTPDQVVMIAGAMLQSSPQDESTTEEVLEEVRSRNDVAVTKRALELFGYFRITNKSGSVFIGASLADADPSIRAAAVETASKFGNGVENPYYAEIARISSNEQESAQTRSAAQRIISR